MDWGDAMRRFANWLMRDIYRALVRWITGG